MTDIQVGVAAHQGLPFVGRERESARLAELLSRTRSGRSAVLVVRGGCGIGKTALLDHFLQTAADHRIVRVSPAAVEADLPYSALHLLCSALSAELAELEPRDRQALETAIGLRPGRPPERLTAGVAMAKLLAHSARNKPLLCVVDDTQWLDRATAHVLASVAPRLQDSPVALVLAGQGDGFTGLPDIVVDGLSRADARQLLERALETLIDDVVIERILAEARGRPRAVIRAARAAAPAEVAGGYGVATFSGTDDVDLVGLSADSKLLLVLAAAEPLGDPARLWRAATRLGIEASTTEYLEAIGLLTVRHWVTFPDPQLRSAIYWTASSAQRRRVHGALAAVTDATTEHDRHLWHLAHSLVTPDEEVSDELVRAATAAGRRGGLVAEAAFFELAALCTVDSARRADRALTAAEAYHTAGASDAAARMIAIAELVQLEGVAVARARGLRARIECDSRRGRSSVARLLASARELDRHQHDGARFAYLEALSSAIFTGHVDVVREALTNLAAHRPKGTDRLLEGVALRWTNGYVAAVEPLKLALKTLDCDHENHPRTRLLAALIAADLWDEDSWDDLTGTQLRHTRKIGARALLPYVLTHRALVEIHTGQFGAAESLVNEATAVSRSLGTDPFVHAAAVLAAWRGEEHHAVPEAIGAAHPRENSLANTVLLYSKALLSNGVGAYADAVRAARHVLDHDGMELQGWSLAELVEGAVRSGDLDTAGAAARKLTERACLSGSEWALGTAARARALVQQDESAENLYVEAIDLLERSRGTVHVARAQLVYGEWLRRQGRRVDARVLLRAADESFRHIGATAFAGRVERELLATGERARRRVPETRGQLTAQERQISALARDGRSNPEIGLLLSISARTVEYHLHKVFTKLGINSRNELHLALHDTPSQPELRTSAQAPANRQGATAS